MFLRSFLQFSPNTYLYGRNNHLQMLSIPARTSIGTGSGKTGETFCDRERGQVLREQTI